MERRVERGQRMIGSVDPLNSDSAGGDEDET